MLGILPKRMPLRWHPTITSVWVMIIFAVLLSPHTAKAYGQSGFKTDRATTRSEREFHRSSPISLARAETMQAEIANAATGHTAIGHTAASNASDLNSRNTTVSGGVDDRPLEEFLNEPEFESQTLFDDERFPNVVVSTDGSVVAIWGQTRLQSRRSTDGGRTWSAATAITAERVIHSGGAIVDEQTDTIWVFAERQHPPAERLAYCSRDHGLSWQPAPLAIGDDSRGHSPSLHMNEHGLQLIRGEHAGRLVRPSRFYGVANERQYWPTHYTNAIYSDDRGATWQTSQPFPFLGTGEAAIVELSDGTLYYNSRRHWAPAGENPRQRWTARSHDGGETWIDGQVCEALPDGPQDTDYGLMAGLARMPIRERDFLIFSNVVSDSGRKNGTVWLSLDGGQSWPHHRLITAGPFAYSSLAVGKPNTPSAGYVYLLYEGSDRDSQRPVGGTLVRFNLRWLVPNASFDQ